MVELKVADHPDLKYEKEKRDLKYKEEKELKYIPIELKIPK